MASIRAPLYEDKIVDFITEMAEISEKKVTREALLAEPSSETRGKPKKSKSKKAPAKKASAKKASAKKTSAKSTPKKRQKNKLKTSEIWRFRMFTRPAQYNFKGDLNEQLDTHGGRANQQR